MHTELTKSKKWLLTGLCTTIVLCCAGIQTVFAQDFEAVGKRLRAAVQAGELNGEQAWTMMDALLRVAEHQASTKDRITPEEYRRVEKGKGSADAEDKLDDVRRRMSVALTAGKITREQAIERMAAYKKRVGQGKGSADTEEKLDDVRRRIAVALTAGTITREQAIERMAAYKKRVGQGKAKPEDVERRLIEMRKHISKQASQSKKGITVEEYRQAEARMRRMVEEGKAKPEVVEQRLIDLRKMIVD